MYANNNIASVVNIQNKFSIFVFCNSPQFVLALGHICVPDFFECLLDLILSWGLFTVTDSFEDSLERQTSRFPSLRFWSFLRSPCFQVSACLCGTIFLQAPSFYGTCFFGIALSWCCPVQVSSSTMPIFRSLSLSLSE